MVGANWCCVVSVQLHVHKHEGWVCTCMGRNGLITCARKVIACARKVITCACNSYYVGTWSYYVNALRAHVNALRAHVKGILGIFFHHGPLGAPYPDRSPKVFGSYCMYDSPYSLFTSKAHEGSGAFDPNMPFPLTISQYITDTAEKTNTYPNKPRDS